MRRRPQRSTLSSSSAASDVYKRQCRVRGIALHHIAAEQAKGKEKEAEPLPVAETCAALQVLISQPALPVYLHCTDGAHHTGGVLMCLRKLQNWHVSAIHREALRFVKTISKSEAKFLTKFCKGTLQSHQWACDTPWLSDLEPPPALLLPLTLEERTASQDDMSAPSPAEVCDQEQGFEMLMAATLESLQAGASPSGLVECVAPTEVDVQRRARGAPAFFSLELEALALEGFTMRGSEVEHSRLARESGRSKQHQHGHYTYLYC
eukprot:TRINITY_DN17462_c0_g2_i1.p1 TRINITY_DN17462_c0_g2~~TRINITY_DN17462_c0_g2_i1.p1  ORF type:complete len:264 (+),score=79.32 TRINITY_DN17462_c0_g2_i1:58-849(+)